MVESKTNRIDVQEIRKLCDKNFEEGDQVDKIEPLIQDLIAAKLQVTKDSHSTDQIATIKEWLADCNSFNMYLEDITLKNRFFYEMANLDTWDVVKNYSERQIYSKKEPGLDLLTVFYKIKLNSNILYPFALLSEIQMMKNWVPGVKKSEIIKINSQFRKAIYVHREMPFPLSDRDFTVCQTSLVVKERKGVMVMIRSANEER
jgi:hypothetical protein